MPIRHDPPLVLVADDEVNATIMLQRIFEREGFQVERVNSGEAALQAARDRIPDLILLDIRMPGMNGFEVLRVLRHDPLTRQIPTILITANAHEPADVALGMDLGADDYLRKPFAPQELVARAHSKMKARQLEEALQRRSQELSALLRVSEALNAHLEQSEILSLVLRLVFDLLPGDLAAIVALDEDGFLAAQRVERRDQGEVGGLFDDLAPLDAVLSADTPHLWTPDAPLVPDQPYGVAVRLAHGAQVVGALILAASGQPYDENHARLLEGVGRQTALALRNAALHEIQVNYALHLEDMVEARTAELQSAQQMLIRAEKLASIGHLASNIAHEINNPLQPITLTLESIVEGVEAGEPVDVRGVAIIQESVERIRRIVRQLLDFTGKGRSGPAFQPLNVSEVLERIRDLNRKFFEKEHMTLELELGATPPVFGSVDQLEQVFMNLVLNAQAAMQPGGRLLIRSYVAGDQVAVTFEDNGCGIPPEQLDHIFDPFFSTKSNGTGLGLFVSYGIMQGHHGMMGVESQVGVGTRFTLTLPLQMERETSA